MAQSANCWDVRLLWGFDRNRLVMSDGWKVSSTVQHLYSQIRVIESVVVVVTFFNRQRQLTLFLCFILNEWPKIVIKGAETQNFATKIGAHKADQGRPPIIAQMLVQIWVVRISLYMYCCFSMIDNLKSSFNLKFFMHYY